MASVIHIEHHVDAMLPAGLEPRVMPALAAELAPLFSERSAPERCGLYVATHNAGTASALEFWADAQRVGVGLASPELFPWCLANAPCGWLAREFQVRGPNTTFVGEADAWFAALEQAATHLQDGRIDHAFIVSLGFGREVPGHACASRAGRGPHGTRVSLGDGTHPTWRASLAQISSLWSNALSMSAGGNAGRAALPWTSWAPQSLPNPQ